MNRINRLLTIFPYNTLYVFFNWRLVLPKGLSKKLRKHSLSQDYFTIFAGIFITIMILSVWYTFSIYNSKENLKEQALFKQGNRINRELVSSFDYVTHLMRFMGKQVTSSNANDLKKIAAMLQGKLITSEYVREQFSWAMFDWSKPDKKIIVSTAYGILKTPIDVSYRNYAQMADKEPWILHFDPASIGVTSGQWIIPAGMGVADERGNLVGILSMGFNISKLTKNIESAIDKDTTSFVILDKDYKIAIHSTDNNPDRINRDYFKPFLQGLIGQNVYGNFNKEIEYNGVVYSSYIKVDGYPYTILMGYNKALAAQQLQETLLPGMIGYSIIGIVALALLLTLRKLIVAPVIRLSSIADKISKGEEVKKIRGGRTYEINNLALQIMKLKHSLTREQQIRKKQRELLKIIRDSDDEKESFLRELYHAMNNPLNIVIAGAEMLKSRQLGNNMDAYNDYFEIMYQAGRQLESYTTDILNPTEVNVKELINRCVRLQKKKASETRLKVEVDVPDDIPPIMVDELRLRQILISTLGQALWCIQDFGTIKISVTAQKKKSGKPNKLIIKIEDDGLGVSESERTEQWERAFGDPEKIYSYSRNPDITRLSFPIIRHLIKLHQGEFELKTVPRIGSTFTIILPYLSKKELETSPRNITRAKSIADGEKDQSTKTSKSTNIIKFPGAE